MAYSEQVENYIKDCMISNIPKDQIVNSLVNSGWSQGDIDDTFATFNAPIANRRTVVSAGEAVVDTIAEAPVSSKLITQKEYPVTVLWIFKFPIIIIFISIAALLFGYWFPDLLLALPIFLVYYLYQRGKIKFSLSNDSISVSGVFQKRKKNSVVPIGKDKKHSVNIPYSSIGSVHVQQDMFDALFGLGGVFVDLSPKSEKKKKGFIEKKLAPLFLGQITRIQGDNFIIPGLTKRNAEILESIILDRMPSGELSGNDSVSSN